ncbi:sugar phosphate isomerase/epimerase family protein [Paenibacillus methanolicus]|uniref:Sugar phosphate isomerase/epimerase n=1 Tax=Paenibacillus methanolicus TaxID=582686 RepID=A0A5S5CB20_9BACL|nr:sugar phosphate isomerase/epimerase family protein [Paenibacillus methanolicus]TYP76585.1 sugar phosphate isomerase/epimerase [Paenibacillus methanolicus]
MPAPRIGLQLYTLRDECAADLLGTLRRVAELGYEGVEFAGYFGVPADELHGVMEELGLTAIASHIGLPALRERLSQEIRYLLDISCSYLVCPGVPGDEHDAESWRRNIPLLRQAADQAAQAGLQFAYHNHAYEFQLELDGMPVFDRLFPYDAVDPAFRSELDTCWAAHAGRDPLAMIRRLSGHVPLLHLKDYRITEGNELDTLPLGEGEAPLDAIIETASDAGVRWLIVEQDDAGSDTPLACVERSMQWLIANRHRT